MILQCEVDPGAQQVLRKHWPSVLLVPDVASLQSLPPVWGMWSLACAVIIHQCVGIGHYMHTQETELLTAGFPCIDVSRAGLRAGLQGQVCALLGDGVWWWKGNPIFPTSTTLHTLTPAHAIHLHTQHACKHNTPPHTTHLHTLHRALALCLMCLGCWSVPKPTTALFLGCCLRMCVWGGENVRVGG